MDLLCPNDYFAWDRMTAIRVLGSFSKNGRLIPPQFRILGDFTDIEINWLRN